MHTEEKGLRAELPNIIADFNADVELTPELMKARRQRICDLEEAVKSLPDSFGPDEINDGKLSHFFGTKVYCRQLFIPKNNLIVSKIHRGETVNIIAKGTISVISEDGYKTYKGPYVFVSKPFTKRVVIAHEDTWWITSHGTEKTDLQEVEDELIAKDFTELMQLEEGL